MGLPAYIPTRTVGFRGVLELEQGKGLTATTQRRSVRIVRPTLIHRGGFHREQPAPGVHCAGLNLTHP